MQPETTTKSQMEFCGGDFSGGSSRILNIKHSIHTIKIKVILKLSKAYVIT
jgi:hypothetical protein